MSKFDLRQLEQDLADVDAMELVEVERRTLMSATFRAESTDGKMIIKGYAARFNSLSEDLGGFREQIKPGAFADAIGKSDIRALFNHDPNMILGRVAAGTLEVKEDDSGLFYQVELPDTQVGRDLWQSIERGDVDQSSFGFTVEDDELANVDGTLVRTIIKVKRLYDVSPVTYPAYTATSVSVRSRVNDMRSVDAARCDVAEEDCDETRRRTLALLELESEES